MYDNSKKVLSISSNEKVKFVHLSMNYQRWAVWENKWICVRGNLKMNEIVSHSFHPYNWLPTFIPFTHIHHNSYQQYNAACVWHENDRLDEKFLNLSFALAGFLNQSKPIYLDKSGWLRKGHFRFMSIVIISCNMKCCMRKCERIIPTNLLFIYPYYIRIN